MTSDAIGTALREGLTKQQLEDFDEAAMTYERLHEFIVSALTPVVERLLAEQKDLTVKVMQQSEQALNSYLVDKLADVERRLGDLLASSLATCGGSDVPNILQSFEPDELLEARAAEAERRSEIDQAQADAANADAAKLAVKLAEAERRLREAREEIARRYAGLSNHSVAGPIVSHVLALLDTGAGQGEK
jgi:hypothetical protein